MNGTLQDFGTLLDQEHNWSDKESRTSAFTEEVSTAAQTGRGLWENNSKRVKEQLSRLLERLEDQYKIALNNTSNLDEEPGSYDSVTDAMELKVMTPRPPVIISLYSVTDSIEQ